MMRQVLAWGSKLRRAALVGAIAAALWPLAGAQGLGSGPAWKDLTASQRAALAPLERDWSQIDSDRKEKWLDIAARFPEMSADERRRVQARMTEWAKLSPSERGQARLRYQEARGLSSEERQKRWEAYQALPPERRREFAAQASPPSGSTRSAKSGNTSSKADAARDKSNLVPAASLTNQRRPVAPTVVQAKPGATTTLISRPPTPPAHQQAGLPKIAATPGFVDRNTLLPQRGPQGAAAVRPDPAPRPSERNK